MFTTNVLLLTYRLLITKALCLVDSAVLKIQNCYSLKALVVVVQSLSCVQLFAIPWTAACQASLSFIISWSLLKLMSIESMMLSNQLILCRPPLLLPLIFPSIRVFSNELFISGGQSIGASASVLLTNIQS